MWVSKKRWDALEKRVADLEGQVQGQLTYDSSGLEESLKGIIQRHREACLMKEESLSELNICRI